MNSASIRTSIIAVGAALFISGCGGAEPQQAKAAAPSNPSSEELRCDNPRCAPRQAGQSCGGITASRCDMGLYCEYPAESCGYADQSGICRQVPARCEEDCPKVCGCDGEIYCNACQAAISGISVADPSLCQHG
jgi:hypothetical protein